MKRSFENLESSGHSSSAPSSKNARMIDQDARPTLNDLELDNPRGYPPRVQKTREKQNRSALYANEHIWNNYLDHRNKKGKLPRGRESAPGFAVNRLGPGKSQKVKLPDWANMKTYQPEQDYDELVNFFNPQSKTEKSVKNATETRLRNRISPEAPHGALGSDLGNSMEWPRLGLTVGPPDSEYDGSGNSMFYPWMLTGRGRKQPKKFDTRY